MFTFGVLGPLELYSDERLLTLSGPRLRTLLALFLIEPGRVVSLSQLINGLWNEDPPAGAEKTVQTYMSRLRQALDSEDPGVSAVLVTQAPGYVLRVDPSTVDAVRFERLAAAGRRALVGAGPDVARARLGDALAMWRGHAYAEFADNAVLAIESERLEELRLTSLEDRIAADLAVGLGAELVAELERIVADHPHRERFWAQLMTAQYRAGRQANALNTFHRARTILVGELGVEPSGRLREVHAMVLDQDDQLLSSPSETSDVGLSGEPVATVYDTFVGRADEMRWLLDLLEQVVRGGAHVALIGGPRGIGKTRLVAQFCRVAARRGATVEHVSSEAFAVSLGRIGNRSDDAAVFILDDLHRADSKGCAALSRLADVGTPPGVFVIGMLDLDDAGAELQLALAALRGRGAVLRVLSPLTEADVAVLVGHYLGGPCPETMIETVYKASAGRPEQAHENASKLAERVASERVSAAATRLRAPRVSVPARSDEVVSAVIDLQQIRRHRADRRAGEPPVPAEAVCPYKGLARFERDDSRYFFGRERLVAELTARLVGSSFLAVVGASGSGKSSLVRAGLLPALASGTLPGSSTWTQSIVTAGVTDMAAIAQTLAVTGDRKVVLVDQFEAVFAARPDDAVRELVPLVMTAAQAEFGSKVVITLRSDYFGHSAAYPELAKLLSGGTLLVASMSTDETRRAIELPARAAGLHLEPGLPEVLVGDVADEPGGLPLLSTALLRLWEQRSGNTLTLAAYHRVGGVRMAIAQLAEEVYAVLTGAQQNTTRRIFLRLAEPGKGHTTVRRRASVHEIAPDGDVAAREVVDIFTARRLLTASEGTVEVAHEALLREWPRLADWLRDDEERRTVRRHLTSAAEDWQQTGRHAAELYRGPRLAAAIDLVRDRPDELTAAEKDFVTAGRAQQARVSRRFRAAIAVLTLLVLVAAGVGVWAVRERNDAVQQEAAAKDARAVALARAVVADATVVQQTDPQLALLLSVAAYRVHDDVTTRGNLLQERINERLLLGHLSADAVVTGMAFDPTAPMLAYTSGGGTIRLADTLTRKPIGTLHTGNPESVDVAFSPDGRTVATDGLGSRGVTVLDVHTHQVIARLRGEPAGNGREYSGAVFNRDGTKVAAIENDTSHNAIRIWDLRSRHQTSIFPQTEVFTDVAFSPDGRRLAAASLAGGVLIEDLHTHSEVRVHAPVQGSGLNTRIAFDAKGDVLAFTQASDSVGLWDVNDHKRLRDLPDVGGDFGDLAFGADGSTLAASGRNDTIELWNIRTHVRLATLSGHLGAVSTLAFTKDGNTLAAGSDEGDITLWNTATDGSTPSLVGYRRGVGDIAFSPNRAAPVLASVGDDPDLFGPEWRGTSKILLWNPDRRSRIAALPTPPLQSARRRSVRPPVPGLPVTHIAFSPDGKTLAGISYDGMALWNTHTHDGQMFPAPDPGVDHVAVAYSPDGAQIAIANAADSITLWNPSTKRTVGTLRGHRRTANSLSPTSAGPALAFSPDSTIVAAGGDLNTVVLWNARSHAYLGALSGHSAAVTTVAFSPRGNVLASGGFDRTIMVWDVRHRKRIATLVGHHGDVLALSISPDGSTLASASNDMTIILWDVRTGSRLATIADPNTADPAGHAKVAFSPDGRVLASAGAGPAIRLWQLDDRQLAADVCAMAGRTLTSTEWRTYLPGETPHRICP